MAGVDDSINKFLDWQDATDSFNYFNRDGEAISFREYSRLCTDMDYKRVALTEDTDGVMVSTVWLGLNHQWDNRRPPLIFETLVFRADIGDVGNIGTSDENYEYRYSTEAEARAGHAEISSVVLSGKELKRNI